MMSETAANPHPYQGWGWPVWLPIPGALLMLLGGVVLLGWVSHQPLLVGLLPGFPPMVMNTALMFVASGLALISMARGRRRSLFWLGACVTSLAGLILAENLMGIDLGLDAPTVHAWAQDGFPNPGRASPITALCFVLISVCLMLVASANPRRIKLAAQLALFTFILSISVGLGHVLKLDALYVSYALRGMAVPTAIGMFVLSLSLYRAIALQGAAKDLIGDDRRIVSVGTVLLVAVAMVTGLPVFFVVKSHIEDTIGVGLRTGLNIEIELIQTILNLRMQRAAIITNRPNATSTLRAIHHNPDDEAARALLQATTESFRPHGFSAMRVTLPADGRVLASSGRFVAKPQLIFPLDGHPEHELLWDGAYYLRSSFRVLDGEVLMATVVMEQPLTQMYDAINGAHALGESGELQVCKSAEGRILCLPSRRHPQPLDLAHLPSAQTELIRLAARGQEGIGTGRDSGGGQVIGAFAPVPVFGLFAVLKLDTAELYAPLRRDLEVSLGLAALLVIFGSLLFRVVVRPLARQIVRTSEASLEQSRALARLHSFQRAVFEQAPDGILVADADGRIIEANARMASLFGYTPEALACKRIEDLVPQRARAQHQAHRAEFAKAPSTRVMSADRTLQGQRADGSEFAIEVALAPLNSEDGTRVIAIVKDVSEARAAETRLRDAVKEKELLLGEIHHRVKNNLQIIHSLLDMQAGLTLDPNAASALRDSQNRIQSMALIHQTLYQSRDFAQVEFGQFLETLIGHLHDSYRRRDLQLSSHAEPVRLSIDRAIPCGLIVNELVTNALKHGFPDQRSGKVTVELRMKDRDHVELAVIDDGVGIADSVDLNLLSSLGMQLVQLLSEQLQAELQIQRRNPTRIALSFPLT